MSDRQNKVKAVCSLTIDSPLLFIAECKSTSGLSPMTGRRFGFSRNPSGIARWTDLLVIRKFYVRNRLVDTYEPIREPPLFLLCKRSIIMASLGYDIQSELPGHPELLQRINTIPKLSRSDEIRSIILEAELLPYNETCRGQGRGPGIEEFWNLSRIRSHE